MATSIINMLIEKLSNNIEEIRLLALREVNTKIRRAIDNDDRLNFNATLLMKSLIRWFGNSPLSAERTVLQLMAVLLNSTYGDEIVDFYKSGRMLAELNKIEFILKADDDLKCLNEVREAIRRIANAKECQERDVQLNLSELTSRLTIVDDDSNRVPATVDPKKDLIKCWTIPGPADSNTLKGLKRALQRPEMGGQHLRTTLALVPHTIRDFPGEYFLQPPYLYRDVLGLLDAQPLITETISLLNQNLLGRIKLHQLAATYQFKEDEHTFNQISIRRYVTDCFDAVLTQLKGSLDKDRCQVNYCLRIIHQLIELAIYDPYGRADTYDNAIEEVSGLARHFRNAMGVNQSQDLVTRKWYLECLMLMIRLVRRRQAVAMPAIDYNPNEFEASRTDDRFHIEVAQHSWSNELRVALLDVSIKTIYPDIYDGVLSSLDVVQMRNVSTIGSLLHCEEHLRSAVKLLREPDTFSDMDVVLIGSDALETLSIHESAKMVRLMIKSIGNVALELLANVSLRRSAEDLLLKLFSYPEANIKRIVYQEVANTMKVFFSAVVDGEQSLKRFQKTESACLLGVPMTKEILTEILTVGWYHRDGHIVAHSEAILTLIVKGRNVLGRYWRAVREILVPVLPLLQVTAHSRSSLGKSILELFDPDANELPPDQILMANIRFLFHPDEYFRQEAVIRLLFIIDNKPMARDYTPNVRTIAGTIPDDVCFLRNAPGLEKHFHSESHFDAASIYSLVNVLKDPDTSLEMRKSSLMQLNAMAMDPHLNQLIHDLDAWFLILNVIDNSLKVDPCLDLEDALIPAVNIFTKMCIQFSEFRREMSKEANLQILLLRALFKYHNVAALKPDCVQALFLLSHADFLVGDMHLSAPLILTKIEMPFTTKDHHWLDSPFYKPSQFEEAIIKLLRPKGNDADSHRSDRPMSLYEFRLKLGENSARVETERQTVSSSVEGEVLWQFLRISFASLWFDGFDKLLSKSESLLYDANGTCLDFNENLKMIKNDVNLITNTMPVKDFKRSIEDIQNATSHQDVVNALTSIGCTLKLNPKVKLPIKKLMKSLDRFCLTVPSTPGDECLFTTVLKFLTLALDRTGFHQEELLSWCTKEFQQKHCNFISLLARDCEMENLYELNAGFIAKFVEKLTESGKVKYTRKVALSLMNPLLDAMDQQAKCATTRALHSLVSVVRIILYHVPDLLEDYNDDFANKLIDRLLGYSVTAKMTCRTGSKYLKECLFAAAHLGKMTDQLKIDKRHWNYLFGLTGHVDMEVRVVAWNVIAMLCATPDTATELIDELQDVPGGFHSGCLSVTLDDQEADLVREAAGIVFADLLRFVDENGELVLIPKSTERELLDGELAADLVFEIVNRHQFVDRIIDFIHQFLPAENVDIELDSKLTYCGTIRAHVMILERLITLDSTILEQIYYNSSLGMELMNLINLVPTDITPNSMEMAAEICKFLILSLQENGGLKERIILSNRAVVGTLVHLLNVNIYENSPFTVNLWTYAVYMLDMLRLIVVTEQGFYMFCQVLEQNEKGMDFFRLLIAGLEKAQDGKLQVTILNFLTTIFTMNSIQSWTFLTVLEMIESGASPDRQINGSQSMDETANNTENICPNLPVVSSTEKESGAPTMAELLFANIFRRFQIICAPKGGTQSSTQKSITCKLLGLFLCISKEARGKADELHLFSSIVDRLRSTFDALGMTCTEFIRRYGDAKKNPILDETRLLVEILIGWYTAESLSNEDSVDQLTNVLLKMWTWALSNQKLQVKFVRLLVILSEDSVPVCRKFASQYSSVSHSMVQLVVQLINQEMVKVKHAQFNMDLLRMSLRVLTNCCCCAEGRIMVSKLNVLDHLNRLHPTITKWQEPWPQISLLWMTFWEIYSRYPEGARICHQNLLFTFIHKGKGAVRLRQKALSVLRNMAFVTENRISFLTSEEFMETVKLIVMAGSQPEQLLILTAVWKLLANSFKAKTSFKSTTIPAKLIMLQKQLEVVPIDRETAASQSRDDILMILKIINTILIS